MNTLKHSSTHAKNGKNEIELKREGLAKFESLLALAESEGDTANAKRFQAIIERLENDIKKLKQK